MSTPTSQLLPELIATKRLILRAFRLSDAEEMHAYLQEPDAGRFLEGGENPLSREETNAIVTRHMQADREFRNVWAITKDDLAIGGISVNFIKEHRVAEVGYHIKKALWGKGYATEAVQAVVNSAFQTYSELQRIQAGIHPDNKGSIRVVEKTGMGYEGTLRAYSYIAGKSADENIYAVIR